MSLKIKIKDLFIKKNYKNSSPYVYDALNRLIKVLDKDTSNESVHFFGCIPRQSLHFFGDKLL